MFDPTLSLLIDAWGFGRTHTASADTADIEILLSATGIDKTRIENGLLIKSIQKHPSIFQLSQRDTEWMWPPTYSKAEAAKT